MNLFKSRMEKLRDKMKRHGMRQISVWVPKEDGNWLREVFSRVGDNTVEGQCFRNFLKPAFMRRRAPGRRYPSNFLACEIDGAYIGVGNEVAPIGGRIYNFTDTLIELSPSEAQDLENEVEQAIEKVLANFLKKNALSGKVRNTTGVVTDRNFLRDVELDIMEDEVFERSETRIVQDFTDHAFARNRPIVQDQSIYKFLGFGNAPSTCQIVEDTTPEGGVYVAFIHIPHAGTSPTNMIQELADEIKRSRYPDIPSDKITWLDVWPNNVRAPGSIYQSGKIAGECWEMEAPRINTVTFEGEGFSNPNWTAHEGVQEATKTKIHEAICRRIDMESRSHFDTLNVERAQNGQSILHFVMPKEMRRGYGRHYVDILFEDDPSVRLVMALISASPSGMGRETEPLLVFSKPGTLEFRGQPDLDNLARRWPSLRRLLDRSDYSWDDPDFQEVCELANIDWRQAMMEFKG